ncbi:MAG: hypothetical protein ABEK50_14600 [bacterium]
MTYFVAYSPVIVFTSTLAAFLAARLLVTGLGFNRKKTDTLVLIAAFLVGLSGLASVLVIPVGYKMLVGILTGVLAGWSLRDDDQLQYLLRCPNWFYLSTLVLILLLAFFVRYNQIGEFGIRIDEPKHLKTAVGYLRTGELRKWNFSDGVIGDSYTRAFLFTKMVAWSFTVLGPGLFQARLVSLVWGLLLFVPLFGLTKILGMRKSELLILFSWVAFSPYLIASSRWVRFYSFFTTLIVSVLICFYWFLYHENDLYAYSAGGAGLLFMTVALHLQLIGLLPVAGILVHVVIQSYRNPDDNPISYDRIMIGGAVTLGLLGFIVTPPGRYFFYLSDSGSAVGELANQLTFRPLYAVYLLGEPFGYLLGGLITAVLLTPTDRSNEYRYFFWTVFLPVLCYLFGARRYPQVRFIGYLYPITFVLFLDGARRLIAGVKTTSRIVSLLLFILVVLVVPFHDLPSDLNRLWAGEMGYVGFPGTASPKYKNWIRDFPQFVTGRDSVIGYNLPDIYAPAIQSSGANVHWVARSKRPQPEISLAEIKRFEAESSRVWLITLRRFHGLGKDVLRYLNSNYEKISAPSDYGNLVIYYRDSENR